MDGKTVRISRDTFRATPPVPLVSAWASANQLILTQVAVADKSNEITALPLVLCQGCLVTIDALGCQRAIARQIVDQGGQDILAVKDNQPDLLEDVGECFAAAAEGDYAAVVHQGATHLSKGHRRVERREHTVIRDPAHLEWVQAEQQWPEVAALGRVVTERRCADGTVEGETR